ncbi:uncharacterized protein LOC135388885 [Ornithodoros turicata]|uniref:uncharacterized protein LOC135388885 n=1 Tax=Ornithodoros turicata TaxID=34597 RepID=UPI0031391430
MPWPTATFFLLFNMTLTGSYDPCNLTLPWTVERRLHKDFAELTDAQFEDKLRCPANLHGCSNDTGTYPDCNTDYYLTCSCSEDCFSYGDCCWDVRSEARGKLRDSRFSCMKLDTFVPMRAYVVAHCSPDWPTTRDDAVRAGCEGKPPTDDVFFQIPATNPSTGITYRNGFCALCNYDIENCTFWNTSELVPHGQRNETVTVPAKDHFAVVEKPDFIRSDTFRYLRPCSRLQPVDTCHRSASRHVKSMCENYFAPIMDEGASDDDDPVVYKNVYCALCNGANVQGMSCSPTEKLGFQGPTDRLLAETAPNLATLLRPVESTSWCYSLYKGVCYIKDVNYWTYHDDDGAVRSGVDWGKNQDIAEPTEVATKIYLSVISLTLSLVCLFLKLVFFFLKKGSRTFSAKCTACLSVTLFITQLIFFVANSLQISVPVCTAVSVIVHYGFVSTFVWTTLLAYDIWQAVLVVSTARRHRLLRYSAIGWGAPMLVILVSGILNWTAPESALSPQYGMRHHCFITQAWSHLTFFVVPMATLLLADIGFYIHTVLLIRKTRSEANRFDYQGREKSTLLFLFVKLALIMGTGWLLGLISVFVNSFVLDCVSIVFIGMQGVYLFFGFKDYRACWKVVPSSASLSALFSTAKSRSSMDSELPVYAEHKGVSGKVEVCGVSFLGQVTYCWTHRRSHRSPVERWCLWENRMHGARDVEQLWCHGAVWVSWTGSKPILEP